MRVRSTSLPSILALAGAAISFSGCAVDSSQIAKRPVDPRQRRESELQTSWRGQPYHTLIESYGTPRLVMDVPGHRPVKTSIAVYGVQEESTYCIDAFTIIVLDEKMLVADYFCR